MRLIDADKLARAIQADYAEVEYELDPDDVVDDMMRIVDEQPTATQGDLISARKVLNQLTYMRRHLVLESDRLLLDRVASYVGHLKDQAEAENE